MAPQHESTPELRRFLVIKFWVGNRENGYLVGPTLVSTRDYKRFHYWDEPGAVALEADDYEVLKVYPLGMTYGEVSLFFARDFPPATTERNRSAGWIASDGTFFSAEGWVNTNQLLVVAA
jgi:hypothetical protein